MLDLSQFNKGSVAIAPALARRLRERGWKSREALFQICPFIDLSEHSWASYLATLDWEQFNALPRTSNVQDIHCVTRWSRFDAEFEGVHWRELAPLAKPLPTARFVIAHAEHGFTSNVPLSFLEDENALLVTHADGEPLAAEHGGPMRLVIPGKYFWKSAKWLRGIELSAVDRLGFWERYGYHNDADPWKEERYSF